MGERAGFWGRLGRCLGVLLGTLALGGVAAAADAGATTGFGQFQVNAGLTGAVWGAGVVPPLTKAFTFTTGFQNRYIPVDGGRAYAFAFPGGTYGGSTSLRLDAVTLSSGQLAWSQSLDEVNSTNNVMVVDGGRVFAAVSGQQAGTAVGDIVLSAINESTGAVIWRDTLDEQTFPNTLIAAGGVLYLEGYGEGGTVYAINESNGARRWTTNTFDANPLTLAGNTVVLTGSDAFSCALNAQTGALVWERSQYCSGGGQGLASFDGTHVWGEDPGGGNQGYIYNPGSGAVVGRFPGYAPAFAYGEAVHDVTSSTGTLEVQAFNPSSMGPLWTFNEPKAVTDPMGSMPLLADGYVFAEGSHATVWALNACTGASVWSGSAGYDAPYEGFDPLPGLSAGDGFLIAPTQIKFTVFKGSATPTGLPPTCAG
jgi:outer membrane protein assembly factor BamB